MYIIADKTAADSSSSEKVTFTLVNGPVDATYQWAAATGDDYQNNAFTVPSGAAAQKVSVEVTAANAGNGSVKCTVKISGDSTGSVATGPDVTVS